MLEKTATLTALSELVAQVAAQHGLATDFGPDESLVDRGLTSMAMVDLLLAVETRFDLTIPQQDITPANFASITSLSRLVERL